jgi:hypothetical protein
VLFPVNNTCGLCSADILEEPFLPMQFQCEGVELFTNNMDLGFSYQFVRKCQEILQWFNETVILVRWNGVFFDGIRSIIEAWKSSFIADITLIKYKLKKFKKNTE